MTTTHILIKELDPEDPEAFRYRIECQVPDSCDGWIECSTTHEVDGRVADATRLHCGPFDCEPDAPWADQEEFEFHGVLHAWRDDHGWTVPFPGCVVAWSDWEPPGDVEALPPGRYQVDDEWEDDSLYLNYVGPEEVSS